MTEAQLIDIARDTIITMMLVAAPPLLTGLVVGLIISILQAVTQIQEMTLTFVPKVGAMILVFWVSMSFMTATLVTFFTTRVLPLVAGG